MPVSDASSALLAAVAAAFLLAGFVKGVVGLGLPTVAMGLLVTAMSPARAAAILIVPSLVTNLWQLVTGRALPATLRRLWPMMAGICLGTAAGAGLMDGDRTGQATVWLGVVLVAYAAFGLSPLRPTVPPRAEPWLGPLVGLLTGIVTAATGVFVVPAVPYLGALRLDRDELITALGLSFTVSTLALAALLLREDAFGGPVSTLTCVGLAAALIGMWLGTRVRGRISAAAFRTAFFLGLLALGVHLALRPLL
ncbi:sulfite exporter TauE/SafE family protein [Enterovirga sp.]|uniref:sulfite exporter TauE/SafE family protein n=1 Tax=Enterovirga sp. TaxID=2026350 RepID=UPI00261DEF37|nr:sulfite exporter TauE/SafE family protein [Enterovirga sp.]MDB5590740.1 hypothetical protein [Enterovirga sp.]